MPGNEPPVLQYHHPDSPLFTIAYISDDEQAYRQREIKLSKEADTAIVTERETIDGEPRYLIYSTTAPESVMPDFETEAGVLAWLNDHFDYDDIPVLLVVADVFDGIRREKEEHGETVQFYKQMQLEKLPVVLDRVEWDRPVADVGGDLLSAFILAHPMPKANHRTGLGLLDRYLTSVDGTFRMPDAARDDDWYETVAEYIYDSKRLVTRRRTTPILRWAHRHGYQYVERKEGIRIDLTAVDFDRRDHYERYTERHQARSRAFVETLVDEAGATRLLDERDEGKQAFVDRLRAG